MLKYDGTVAYYLNPNDLTKKADGSASDVANINFGGNAMMEWPKIYVKRWESGGVYHFRCSDVKVDADYECWSNYDKNNKEIPHFYTPIFDGAWDSSGRMRSISGQTCKVSTTAQQEIDAAKLNGANIWYTEVIADIFLVQDLLTMMFKGTDLQVTAGYGRVSASSAMRTEKFGRLATAFSGSTTTFEADYGYYNNSGVRYAIVGGSWSHGLAAGLFYISLSNAPDLTSTYFGAALSCKPLAAA